MSGVRGPSEVIRQPSFDPVEYENMIKFQNKFVMESKAQTDEGRGENFLKFSE